MNLSEYLDPTVLSTHANFFRTSNEWSLRINLFDSLIIHPDRHGNQQHGQQNDQDDGKVFLQHGYIAKRFFFDRVKLGYAFTRFQIFELTIIGQSVDKIWTRGEPQAPSCKL